MGQQPLYIVLKRDGTYSCRCCRRENNSLVIHTYPAILRMCLTTGFTVVTMLVLSPVLTFAILPLIPLFHQIFGSRQAVFASEL
jgi:hypothetical protein